MVLNTIRLLLLLTTLLSTKTAQRQLFTLPTYATQSSQCGYKTTDLEGTISSPEYRHYSSASCVWNITAPVGYSIHLQITSFSIPGNVGSCSYAWLIIQGTVTANSTQINRKLCGSEAFPGNIFFGNRVNIEYYYNGNAGLGQSYFTVTYRSVPVDISEETARWISSNEEALLTHKESLPRALPALRLFNETYFSKENIAGYKFKTQYFFKLSVDLLRNSTQALSVADLSHHVFALLAICTNPRSFHGIDLVQHLRSAVDKQPSLAKPFDLFTLCSAGGNLTSGDIKMLNTILNAEKPNIFMLDFRAIAIMTLICAKQQNEELPVDQNLQKASDSLSSYQRKDGSFGSLQSTVLIVQALSAAGAPESRWNKTSALRFIQNKNHTDGSFGNIYDMYTVLPVLRGKTLLDINAPKCDFSPEGVTPLQEVKDKMAELISLTYQLWVGDGADVKYTITMKFANGTKFFDVMRLAAEKDTKFHLKWTFTKDDLYVYEIAGHINDPTGGKYWNLYIFNQSNQLVPFEERLENFIPSDGETAVMWYRTVDLQQ